MAARNPFSNERDATRTRLEELWSEEQLRRSDPLTHRRWAPLLDWRERCAERDVTPVFLKTGPQSGKLAPEENQRVFAGHFANMKRLALERRLLLAGRLDDTRAFAILDALNVDSARALLGPLVERLGEHALDEWFGSGGLVDLGRIDP